jgi:hypothetical protein
MPAEALRELAMAVDDRARAQAARLWGRRPFEAELRPRENPGTAIRVTFDGRRAWALLGPSRRCPVALELRVDILRSVLRDPFGFEAVTIGYGAVARLSAASDAERVNDLLRLVRPRAAGWKLLAQEMRRGPARVLRALWEQRLPLSLALAQRWGLLRSPAHRVPSATEAGPTRRRAA